MHAQIAGKLTGRVSKWLVLLGALVVVALMTPLNAKLIDVQNNEASSWLPESAEATKVLGELTGTVDPNDIPTLVVYHRDGGLTDADLAAMDAQAAEFAEIKGVTDAGAISPNMAAPMPEGQGPTMLSKDREVGFVAFTFNLGDDGWALLADAGDEVRKIANLEGGEVFIAGSGGQAIDSSAAFEGIDSNLIMITLSVVIVILLFTYRSPFLWMLPIICAVVSYVSAGGVVYLLAKYADLTVNGQSQAILGILVIGAGTDYALLLVARYREELRRHEDRHEAMAFALHRAAPAILASASTVVIGMLCLVFATLSSTSGLGPVLAVGIGVTYVVMVTLLPALLVICGRWIFWPKRPAFGSPEPTGSGMWAKVGNAMKPNPRKVWVTTAALLAIACLGLFKLDPSGLSTEETYTKKFDSIQGQILLSEHGLADTSNTAQVVTNASQVPAVQAALAQVDGLGETSPAVPLGGDRVYLQATVDGDVSSSKAYTTVSDAREAVHDIEDADALVGGSSALYLDIKEASERDTRVIIPIVLVVVLLILILLLRALVAPLLLMATVVLSFGAALGISTLLFTEVFTRLPIFENNDGFAHVDPGFMLFAFVFLVALGIDYNIFLMTRVREETANFGTFKGSLVALSSTGGVITSAGLVLAATFMVLGSLPLVFLAQLGITVALGVLLDTMIVRSVLVTALNLDLGGRIWWPSKLGREVGVTDR